MGEVVEYGKQTDIYRHTKYGRGKIITTIKSTLTFPFDTMHFSSMVFTLQPHRLRVLAGEILSLAMVRRLLETGEVMAVVIVALFVAMTTTQSDYVFGGHLEVINAIYRDWILLDHLRCDMSPKQVFRTSHVGILS